MHVRLDRTAGGSILLTIIPLRGGLAHANDAQTLATVSSDLAVPVARRNLARGLGDADSLQACQALDLVIARRMMDLATRRRNTTGWPLPGFRRGGGAG